MMISPSCRNNKSLFRAFSKKFNVTEAEYPNYYWHDNEKMRAANDKSLALCHELNKINPADQNSKRKLLKEIFGYQTDAVVLDNFHCEFGYNTKIGKNVRINCNCSFVDDGPIEIGDNVVIGSSVTFGAGTHPIDPEIRLAGLVYAKPIKVGNNVWIGSNCVIGPGVTIGDNSVISSGSVVVKNIPSNCIASGNPALVIKHL